MQYPEPKTISGETPFRVYGKSFAIGKVSTGTTLQVSVNGEDWEEVTDAIDDSKNVNIIKDMPAGLLYKLNSNALETELVY